MVVVDSVFVVVVASSVVDAGVAVVSVGGAAVVVVVVGVVVGTSDEVDDGGCIELDVVSSSPSFCTVSACPEEPAAQYASNTVVEIGKALLIQRLTLHFPMCLPPSLPASCLLGYVFASANSTNRQNARADP